MRLIDCGSVKIVARVTRHSRIRSAWALGTVLLLVSFSPVVELGVADAADAAALVKEGIGLRREGKDLAALKKFEEANALQYSPRTVAQIGLAEQAIGRWGAADRHLRAALSEGDDAWVVKNRKSLEQALKTVGQHTGQLEIAGTPAGSEVLVDGEPVGKLPLAGPIGATAGVVAIEVRAPGYMPVVRSAQVVTGGLARESFNLQSANSPSVQSSAGSTAIRQDLARSVTPSDPSSDGGGAAVVAVKQATGAAPPEHEPAAVDESGGNGGMPPLRIAALVVAGLSVGAVAFGVFEHLKWQDRVATFGRNTSCDLGVAGHGSTACQTLYDDGQGARTLAFVGYGVAGGLAATAVVLYLVSPDSSPPSRRVACGIGPGSWGLACSSRF